MWNGKERFMRLRWAVATVLLCGGLVFGQGEPQPDYKKMYDDAVVQMRQAQERKNDLADQLTDAKKQLAIDQAKLDEASRTAGDFARRTFFLRAHYAAWQEFIGHYPKVQHQWEIFLAGESETILPTTAPAATTQELIDTEWPLSAMK
jgi:hypothetical protein